MSEVRAAARALSERAFSMPRRTAPLVALAMELRMPGVWIQVCRTAARSAPEWLEERLEPGDPLVAAIGTCGVGKPDEATARAVCALALGLCGRLDEGSSLAPAAALLGEPAPPDLTALDRHDHPRLGDLVAELRGEHASRSWRVSTVVSARDETARAGVAIVSLHPDRAPGLRLDAPMRLFAFRDEPMSEAIDAVRAALPTPGAALLVRVESESGEAAGGDACAAAIAAAAEAASRGRSIDSRVTVAGALDRTGAIRPSRQPDWEQATKVLGAAGPDARIYAPGIRPRPVESLRTLRRALAAPARRRRSAVVAAVTALGLAAAAAAILPGLGADADADSAARQAIELLPASPMHAAVSAARGLDLGESPLTREAAVKVLAAAPLTEVSGQEEGHLIAVAIDGAGEATTVSTKGRVTRWEIRDGRLHPLGAVAFPAGSEFLALSQSGRWLLVRPPESYEEALLIDTTGRRATRYLALPDEGAFAVGDSSEPVVAFVAGGTLKVWGAPAAPAIDGNAEVVALSPSGKLLAVAADAGRTAIFRRAPGGWRLSRGWRTETGAGFVAHLEVDDAGRTLLSASGLGDATFWASPRWKGDYQPSDAIGSLAGRSLYFVHSENELRLMQATRRGSAQAASFPAPVDGATERGVAVSPDGSRAMVAGPDGLFSLLDLRRVRMIPGGILTDSIDLAGSHLSVVEGTRGGTRLVSWDLSKLAPATVGPPVPGVGQVGVVTAEGELVVSCSELPAIAIRRASDGEVVGWVRGRGDESWGNLAADREGRLLAAVDAKRDAVTVWRLRHEPGGSVTGRVVYRGPAIKRAKPAFPDPLAISPDGRTLVYGTATRLIARDLRTGAQWDLPLDDAGEVVRVRFPTDRRLLVSGSRGAFELSGKRLSVRHQLLAERVYDAGLLASGLVVIPTREGIQVLAGRQPILISQAYDAGRIGPGTVSVTAGGAVFVPTVSALPLVLMEDLELTPEKLCALAGRAAAPDGCAPPPPLPPPLPPLGTAADRSPDVALSPEGLGWLRLGQPLPREVRRLPGYAWGACQARTLPGLGAAVITHAKRLETIVLFRASYADDDAPYEEERELATDRGLTPGAATYSAPLIYGPPDETLRDTMRWWLPRRNGGRTLLEVDSRYRDAQPLAMSVEERSCEGWA